MSNLAEILPRHGIDARRWICRASHAFAPIDFRGKTVLDVGSGVGWASYYAAEHGARKVISVEPEADGSRSSMLETAEAIRDDLGLADVVEIVPAAIEEVEVEQEFDVVLMVNSINHLNEPACTVLDRDDRAWSQYGRLMARIAAACVPGGKLLVTDCTNRNVFGDLGLRSPLCPTIEWEKHQPPEVWARLLSSVGFTDPQIAWTPHARLGPLGRPLAAHKWLAYFVNSHFRLTMVRQA